MCAARQIDLTSPTEPFREWRRAVAALNGAHARGAHHDELVRLSAEVVRTRSAVTVTGLSARDDILEHLTGADVALIERDGAAPA